MKTMFRAKPLSQIRRLLIGAVCFVYALGCFGGTLTALTALAADGTDTVYLETRRTIRYGLYLKTDPRVDQGAWGLPSFG